MPRFRQDQPQTCYIQKLKWKTQMQPVYIYTLHLVIVWSARFWHGSSCLRACVRNINITAHRRQCTYKNNRTCILEHNLNQTQLQSYTIAYIHAYTMAHFINSLTRLHLKKESERRNLKNEKRSKTRTDW